MKWSIRSTFSEFFFKPISPYPLALFRILFGLCVCATLLLLHSDWLAFFGVRGWISATTIGKAESGFRLNLFAIIPQDDQSITALYWLLLVASIALTVGFWTRTSSVLVYLGLNSLNQRNPLVLHGGDTLLRSVGFFLMFASAGSAFSIDRMWQYRRVPSGAAAPSDIVPWAQRMIQCQFAIVYLAGFWWKVKGSTWRDGTALFYVTHLRELQRFPLPSILEGPRVLHLGTVLALVFEILFPLIVWFKPFRYPLLLAGVLFHLSLEYALNIPMFQWDMLAVYPLFVDGTTIRGLARSLLSPVPGKSRVRTGN